MAKIDRIPDSFRVKLEEEIIPLLLETGKSVLGAHAVDPEHFGNYFVGCACWDNAFSRLIQLCNESEYFSGIPFKNTLEIKASAEGMPISFYVSRVDEKTRVPNAGKSIKRKAEESKYLYLSDELEELAQRSGVYTLGYDIDTQNGLGTIGFVLLTHVKARDYQAQSIFTFNVDIAASTYTLVKPAVTTKPIVTKRIDVEGDANAKKA